MRISLVRSGGVAGMRRETTIDTSELAPILAQEFHRLVESADLPGLVEPAIRPKTEPDRFRYTLTVEDGARRHAVTFEEHRVPEPLQPLVAALQRGTGEPGPGTQTA
jgi:hypothetical protein